MDNGHEVWCIPTDCVPFLAAATSWDQTHINLGNKFLSDTTDKILTQIRDLLDLDEPSINQDLLIANVSEKIFLDYRSIIKNVDQTYEQGIHEVFNQYKHIISSRAASGDMPDQCVKEIVCTMEQFKTRLLARAGKMVKGNMIDQMIKLIEVRLKEKRIDSNKLDLVKEELVQLINNLLDNKQFNKLDAEKKTAFVQARFEKMVLDKYDNDPNIKTIINKVRLVTLPIIRNHIEKYKPNEVRSMANMDENVQSDQIKHQERGDVQKSEFQSIPKVRSSYQRTKQMNPSYDTTPLISKRIPDEINQKDRQRMQHEQKLHHRRKDHDRLNFSPQISNTFIPFTDCADYDPYRNYAKYKEKRLHNNVY